MSRAGPRLSSPASARRPARPLLPGFFRVIPMGPDDVQLRSAGRLVRLSGSGIGAAAPPVLAALDGRSSVEELAARLGVDVDVIAGLVERLFAEGVLTDAGPAGAGPSTPGPAGSADLYADLARVPGQMHAALGASSVVVIGPGGTAHGVAGHLAAAGVGTLARVDSGPLPEVVAGANLVIAETGAGGVRAGEVNVACLDAGVPCLFHDVGPLEALIGPLARPPSPCYECLVERRVANLRHIEEHLAWQQWLRDTAPPEPPLLGPWAALVAGLIALEAIRVVGGFLPPTTDGGVLVADAATLEVRREHLLAVPECRACGGRREEVRVLP